MPVEASAARRRACLRAMGIDIWMRRPMAARRSQATVTPVDAAAAASASVEPAVTPPPLTTAMPPAEAADTESEAGVSWTHECLLLCQAPSPLLLDLLRLLPPLRGADEAFLASHAVSARRLQRLRPRILLREADCEPLADIQAETELVIDTASLEGDPGARRALWQRLRALPWSR
jgi:hypothetical protein